MTAHKSNVDSNYATSPRRCRLAVAALVPLFCCASAAAQCLEVKAGDKLDITADQTVDCLKIDPTGCLKIAANVTLTISGNTPHDTSTVDGTIVLAGDEATLKIIQSDHTLSGQGRLIGKSNSALIQVTGNLALTSSITIKGALEIRAGSGEFVNDGLVMSRHAAPDDDTLTVYSGTLKGGGTYQANRPGSTLRFRANITVDTGFACDFSVLAGELDIDEDVQTSGDLSFSAGTISVAAGKTFSAGSS